MSAVQDVINEHTLSLADRSVNDEMQLLLDQYLPNRKPVSPNDYDWQAIRPETVDQEILKALTFVTLVECNPSDPAGQLLGAADRDGAPWLRRFIDQTWLPEESAHHTPYKEYLLRSGASTPQAINARISDVRSRGFLYGEGYTALKASVYGWIQELITWRFYEAMRSHLLLEGKDHGASDPVLIQILGDIAKQENFHRHVYLTGIKSILRHSPERKVEVAEALAEFMMPGHHMVPDLQPYSAGWAQRFNLSLRVIIREIVEGVIEVIGYKGLGKTASLRGSLNSAPWFIRIPVYMLKPFSNSFGSPINEFTGRLIAQVI